MSTRQTKPEFTFQIEDYLAQPEEPSFDVQYSPGEFAQLSVHAVEGDKERLREALFNIPGIQAGPSHRQLAFSHTRGNLTLAAILVALGDYLNVWDIHPSPSFPALWRNDRAGLHPSVLAGTARRPQRPAIPGSTLPPRRVPKPSDGDLDMEKICPCCARPMGPFHSTTHDLFEVENGVCWECADLGYDEGMNRDPRDTTPVASRQREARTPKELRKTAGSRDEGDDEFPDEKFFKEPAGLDGFLSNFGE